ncbi:MAG: hydrogenase maturation nickel metallochaperone HypA [Candidatus Aenigmarchaeota archaeon]|nr:hydrogenase maturation nickel metallochaperone HypA [Candidatus Aenigmarchaeota archaeon]
MHDITVAQSVAEEIIEKLRGKRPKSITVEMDVGALRFHDTTQVGFWLKELLRKEFGKKLRVSSKIGVLEAKIRCECGYEGPVEDIQTDHELMHQGIYTMKCPKCGSEDYELAQGNEIVLKKINVTE